VRIPNHTRRLQAIVFDFDGVIANSEPLHLTAFQRTLADDELDLTADDYYRRYLGYDDVGMFEAYARDRRLSWGRDRVAALVTRKGQVLDALLHAGSVLFPGAKAFIQKAAAAVPIAIASGAQRHEIVEIVEGAGLVSLFAAIVAAGDTPEGKPSPAPYRLAFEKLRAATERDLDPRRCVAIEDSRWGLESALGAGLRCVGVTNSYAAHELTGAELVVSNLMELTLPALDRLCEGQP
jgi:HAD superfamily hydrolase (TIGR01509 family)